LGVNAAGGFKAAGVGVKHTVNGGPAFQHGHFHMFLAVHSHSNNIGLTQFMSFRGAKRREIPETCVCKLTLQGFLAPDVARNDI
jgi:hypothetical protein